MKVVIELDDAALRHAIEAQVGKSISELSSEVISKKIDEILEKKFARISDAAIEKAIHAEAKKTLEGNSWGLPARIDKYMATAAKEVLRERIY